MRCERIIAIILLINVVYAFINVFQLGSFIPLVPLHEVFLASIFVVVLGNAIIHKNSLIFWTATVFTLILIAKSEFVLGLFLTNETLHLYDQAVTPILAILYASVFALLFFIAAFRMTSSNILLRVVAILLALDVAILQLLGASDLMILLNLMLLGVFMAILLQRAVQINAALKCLAVGILGFVIQHLVNELPTLLT